MPFRDLDGVPPGRGDHGDMIPTILIAEEGNPFAVGRGPRLRSGFAPVGNAPEFFYVYFMNRSRGAGGRVGQINEIFLKVAGLAVEDQMSGVNPGQAPVHAGLADG